MFPLLVLLASVAAPHQATPPAELHHKVQFVRTPPPTPDGFNAAAAKSFEVRARTFEFEFAPALVVVNQGDSVSLRITSEDVTHGFFLENYMTEGVVLEKGKPVTVNFIAGVPGTFTYVCTIVCGSFTGHANMLGELTVMAVDEGAPVIASFTPVRGPVAGGSVVVINGSNFQNGARVLFGDSEALSVFVDSASRITAFTPARAAGDVNITVINANGGRVTSASVYTFEGPPAKKRRAVKR